MPVPSDSRTFMPSPTHTCGLTNSCSVTFQEVPATGCDLTQPFVDGEDVFTTGTVVDGLIPNTAYECFVIAFFDGNAQCTAGDSTDVVPTLPNPPTDVTVSNPTSGSLDVAAVAPTASGGNALPVQGYAFQCSLESECNPSGPWFPSSAPFASDPTIPVTVSGLDDDTAYNCWAATIAGESAPYEYSCSVPAQDSTTSGVLLGVVGIPGATSFYLNAPDLSDPVYPDFEGWSFQCVAGNLGSYDPCDPSGPWYVAWRSIHACVPRPAVDPSDEMHPGVVLVAIFDIIYVSSRHLNPIRPSQPSHSGRAPAPSIQDGHVFLGCGGLHGGRVADRICSQYRLQVLPWCVEWYHVHLPVHGWRRGKG